MIFFLFGHVGGYGYYLWAFLESKKFYADFLSKKRKFDLQIVNEIDVNIDAHRELIYYSLYFHGMGSENKNFSAPIIAVKAKPISGQLYLGYNTFQCGPNFCVIVCRTSTIDKNSFEEFLFYNSLEKITDLGRSRFLSICKIIFKNTLYLSVFFPFIKFDVSILPYLAALAIFSMYTVLMKNSPLAYNVTNNINGIFRIKDKSKRFWTFKVIEKLLANMFYFSSAFNTEKTLRLEKRLGNMKKIEPYLLNDDATKEAIDSQFLKNKLFFNNYSTPLISILIVYFLCYQYFQTDFASEILFYSLLGSSIFFYTLIWVLFYLWIFSFREISKEMVRHLPIENTLSFPTKQLLNEKGSIIELFKNLPQAIQPTNSEDSGQ